MIDKRVAGETAGKPSRSKEAERSASRRAADPEGHRQMHEIVLSQIESEGEARKS